MRARLKLSALALFFFVPIIHWIARLRGISSAHQFASRLPLPVLPNNVCEDDKVELLFAEYKRLRQHWLWGGCVARSIVLFKLLKRQGISTEFCIGVRKRPSFRAHAWIEYNGTPLNAEDIVRSRYTVIQDYRILKAAQFK